MDATTMQYQFREGDDVVGSDGEKLGKIHSVGQSYLVVEKGFFFPTDYYIPFSAISSYDEGEGQVYLSVSKDDAMNSGWDVMPEGDAGYTTTVGSASTAMTGASAGMATDAPLAGEPLVGSAGVAGAETYTENVGTTGAAAGQYVDQDRIAVPVHEEELVARTRERELGEVQIHKDVVTEQQTLEVPVTEERVRVTRRTVDQEATTGDVAFQEETFEVPVRREEVELGKRVRVAEEVEVEKEAVQRTQQVTGEVRREVVEVEDATGITGTTDVTGTTGATGSGTSGTVS